MSGGKIVLLIVGLVLTLVGFGLTVGGGILLWAQTVGTDEDGFLTSPDYALETDGYAITASDIQLRAPDPSDWLPFSGDVDVRVEARTDGPSDVFIGIAPAAEVSGYLAGVPYAEVVGLGASASDVDYAGRSGGEAPADPTTLDIWVAETTGPGGVTLDWALESGDWAAVIMNADATQGVRADTSVGVQLGGLLTAIGAGLLISGIILLIGGIVLVIVPIVRRDRDDTPIRPDVRPTSGAATAPGRTVDAPPPPPPASRR